MKIFSKLLIIFKIISLSACGGGGSSVPISVTNTYTISGTVSGLSNGNQIVLLNSGGNAVTVTSNANFSFSNPIAYNGSYSATIGTQPAGQTCTVINGTGVGVAANVSDISVICSGTNNYTGTVSTFAGTGAQGSADGAGTSASFNGPGEIAIDVNGNLYVSDSGNFQIRKLTSAGFVSTFAGGGSGANRVFNRPNGVSVDAAGDVYVADPPSHKIRKINAVGVVSVFAGTGAIGSADGIGTSATFNTPNGVAVDASGNVYVVDTGNQKIRKITAAGVVSTLAGTGVRGTNNGTAANATFTNPNAIAIDVNGNIYVAEYSTNTIRKIDVAGTVSTLAGTGLQGSADGAGQVANFNGPNAIATDSSGNVYVAESGNQKIRKISAGGIVSTLAGTGARGSNDGPLRTATFSSPAGIVVDTNGSLYIIDSGNNKIRKITF